MENRILGAVAQVQALYAERGKRAGQLHDWCKQVIGYFGCFVPDEIISGFSAMGATRLAKAEALNPLK